MFDFDRITGFYERALDGLAQRQNVIGHNIANQSTPGYHARRVDFEAALKQAEVDGRGFEHVTVSTREDQGAPRSDGNNVNLEFEWMQLEKTRLLHSLLTRSLGGRFSAMVQAIRSQ